MMTTATTAVVKEDLVTPADPFDLGAGRVDLTRAGNPALTIDETAERMIALANDPEEAVHLNLPSINAPTMPGRLTTTRTVFNVGSRTQNYRTSATAPNGSSITVEPHQFRVGPGRTQTLTVTIASDATSGQYFGQVVITPIGSGSQRPPTLHLPVAFAPQQGSVSLTSECDPDSVPRGADSLCRITAQNTSMDDAVVNLTTTVDRHLQIVGAVGATLSNGRVTTGDVTLAGARPGVPAVDPGELFGYVPLDALGIAPAPIGDEAILNINVPPFVFNGQTFSAVGVDSNGYLVAGGGTGTDNNCCNLPAGPDPAPPNNVLAPFWTDLDGTGAPGILAGVVRDSVSGNRWVVVEWRVNVFGTTDRRTFQVWLGVNGEQDITFAYAAPQADPAGQDFLVGAENEVGQGDVAAVLPTEDLRVTSSDPVPGDSRTYAVVVRGRTKGVGIVHTEMVSSDIPGGVTVVNSTVTVT